MGGLPLRHSFFSQPPVAYIIVISHASIIRFKTHLMVNSLTHYVGLGDWDAGYICVEPKRWER